MGCSLGSGMILIHVGWVEGLILKGVYLSVVIRLGLGYLYFYSLVQCLRS